MYSSTTSNVSVQNIGITSAYQNVSNSSYTNTSTFGAIANLIQSNSQFVAAAITININNVYVKNFGILGNQLLNSYVNIQTITVNPITSVYVQMKASAAFVIVTNATNTSLITDITYQQINWIQSTAGSYIGGLIGNVTSTSSLLTVQNIELDFNSSSIFQAASYVSLFTNYMASAKVLYNNITVQNPKAILGYSSYLINCYGGAVAAFVTASNLTLNYVTFNTILTMGAYQNAGCLIGLLQTSSNLILLNVTTPVVTVNDQINNGFGGVVGYLESSAITVQNVQISFNIIIHVNALTV
jgi:hypothetical protein